MSKQLELKIRSLGASADGIADGPDGPIYVPFALPGEIVVAEIDSDHAKLSEFVRQAPERQMPVCRHFGTCGGCACQHMAPSLYASWKRNCIKTALAKKDIDTEIRDMVSVGLGARRKAVFSLRPSSSSQPLAIGFHKEGTNEVINLSECPVVDTSIVSLLPRLRAWLAPIANAAPELRISVLAADNGLDIDLTNIPNNLPRTQIAHLSATGSRLSAIRVTRDGDPLYASSEPFIACGAANVVPPAGTFVQASAIAQCAMAAIVTDALPKRTKVVADLFCGIGAFTFPIAKKAQVHAFDTNINAIDALQVAARHTQGIKKITAKTRDLYQEPLSRRELDEFDAIVFDPPRAGAKNQSENIAKSKVPFVAAVSCNPATFARDARTLIDGGYALQYVTPIDQFVYSAHIELVALFQRER